MALHSVVSTTTRYISCRSSLPRVCASICTSHFENLQQSRQFHSTKNLAAESSSSPQVEQIFKKILYLDTIEVHLLTELVNEKMGIKKLTPAQREAMARSGGGATGAQVEETEEKEEKTAFDLKLTGFDAKSKIKVIKEIRTITGLGLKEAKAMVEGAPKVVKTEIKMEEAEELKAKLEAVGGTVEIS
jgi:large subunit ribosomal protein L7/L12